MGAIIGFIFLIVIALAAFAIAIGARRGAKKIRADRKENGARLGDVDPAKVRSLISVISFGTGILFTLFAVMSLISSVLVTVPTKEIGVVTQGGRPVGSLSNGWHMKAPWQNVTMMDAAIQTDTYAKGKNNCVNVRIAHQATACVDASIRWRIDPSASDALFQNYREFDSIRASLVERQLQASLNSEFANYDAIAVDDKGTPTAPSLATIGQHVTNDMKSQLKGQIEVLSVIVPVIQLDENTQSKANQLLAEVSQTRIKAQSVKTAQEQAKANKALSESVSKDPNVLVSKCLDMIESGKNNLPAGFSCWPGNGSSVVIPSASK